MLFMRAEDRRRFPYDPELDFGLHAAEQVLYAVRLWTHGFDIFCPTQHALATTTRDLVTEFPTRPNVSAMKRADGLKPRGRR